MTEMINNDTVRETFVLVGAQTPDMSGNIAMEDSLNELEELVHTAGAEAGHLIFLNGFGSCIDLLHLLSPPRSS